MVVTEGRKKQTKCMLHYVLLRGSLIEHGRSDVAKPLLDGRSTFAHTTSSPMTL